MTGKVLSHQIGDQIIHLTTNSSYKEGESLTDVFLRWFGNSSEPIYRMGKLVKINAKLINEALVSSGRPASDSLKGIADRAGIMSDGTAFFRLPSLWEDASKAISNWTHGVTSTVGGGLRRRMINLTNKVAEAVSMTMISLSMVFSSFVKTSPLCKPIRLVADVTGWAADFSSAAMSAENLAKARAAVNASQQASPEFRRGMLEVQRRNLLSVVKEVCGAAGAAFGVIALATGFTMAPVTLLTLSLAGTLFAVWGKIYEESMEYKCNFFNERNVQMIV